MAGRQKTGRTIKFHPHNSNAAAPRPKTRTPRHSRGGGGGSKDDEDSDVNGEDLGDKGCYDCNNAVRPSSGWCTHCFTLNYIYPDTEQCFDPGAWVWHQCSSLRPGFKAPGRRPRKSSSGSYTA